MFLKRSYYEKKTQNQELINYQEYLEERSQTEYSEEAAKILLKLISAGADSSDYQQFINQYSEFEASRNSASNSNGLNYEENGWPELLTHKKDSLYYFYNLEEEKLMSFQFEKAVARFLLLYQKNLSF